MLELNTAQTNHNVTQRTIEITASIPGWVKYLMIIGLCIAGYYIMKYAGLFEDSDIRRK